MSVLIPYFFLNVSRLIRFSNYAKQEAVRLSMRINKFVPVRCNDITFPPLEFHSQNYRAHLESRDQRYTRVYLSYPS